MMPLISIIIPCYNHGLYIEEAIKSIEQAADESIYEIIIVNDGSTDEHTLFVLSSLEKRGYFILNQSNQGLAAARNNGIKICKAKYFLPLDADNHIRKGYIEKSIKLMDEDSKIGLVYGNSEYFGDERKIFKAGKFSLKKLLIENYIDACAVIRKESWEQVGGYDSELSPYEDWDINLSLASLGWKFHYISEIMFDYRVSKNSMIRSHPDLQNSVDRIAKKHSLLYKQEFLSNITIKARLKSLIKDAWLKLKGNPQY